MIKENTVGMAKMATSREEGNLNVIKKLKKIRDDCSIEQDTFDKMILDTSKEVLDLVFGDEIRGIVWKKIERSETMNKPVLDVDNFLVELEGFFGVDYVHIQKMIEGKILAKCHQNEMLKKIQLPLSKY